VVTSIIFVFYVANLQYFTPEKVKHRLYVFALQNFILTDY